MAETLSIHSSHASLSARGHSLKNLFFVPVFETGHLPSPSPGISTRFDQQRRSRTKDGAELEKSVSRDSRELRAQLRPQRFPSDFRGRVSGRTLLRTNKGRRNSKGGRGRVADPPTIPSGCVWQRAKGPFHRFALFSARLFARPARNQLLHCPRGQYIYREERPTLVPPTTPSLPRVQKFSKIRADRSFFFFLFSFSRAIINIDRFSGGKSRDNRE